MVTTINIAAIRNSILYSTLTILACLCFSINISAQVTPPNNTFDYSNKRTFNIGEITITGAESRDRNAIKSIAGLRAGKEITIPGDDIPRAVKSLLKLGLFEDVQVIQKEIKGDLIFLEILLIDNTKIGFFHGSDGGRSTIVIEQSQLTEIIATT